MVTSWSDDQVEDIALIWKSKSIYIQKQNWIEFQSTEINSVNLLNYVNLTCDT